MDIFSAIDRKPKDIFLKLQVLLKMVKIWNTETTKSLISPIIMMVMMHLLGINTESTRFQLDSTGFKLVSGANNRFEQFKIT